MHLKKEEIIGISVSLLVGIVLILICAFTYFKSSIKENSLSGIQVDFVDQNDNSQHQEGPPSSTADEHVQKNKTKEIVQADNNQLIAQEEEKTISVKKTSPKKIEKEKSTQREDEKKKIESEITKIFGSKGKQKSANKKDEATGGNGSSSSNNSQGKSSGIGSYDLGGRGTDKEGLKLPDYNVNDYGKIVVNILVNPSGQVIETEIGKGTNASNARLINNALRAAKQTKFVPINAVNNQRGTITYRFNLKN